MKNAIKHITIYLLTAIVLIASTGFSACCMFGCCDVKVENGELTCCQTTSAESISEHPLSECPDCDSEYINLDADFLLTSSNFKINFSPVAVFHPLIHFTQEYSAPAQINPLEHDLPPPPHGKKLLPLIQSFLC